MRTAMIALTAAMLLGSSGSNGIDRQIADTPQATAAPVKTAGLLVPKRVRLIIRYQRTALV